MNPKFLIFCFIWCIVILPGCRDETIFGKEQQSDNQINGIITIDSDTVTDGSSDSESVTDTDSTVSCGVPAGFKWTSSDMLIFPKGNSTAIKDPSALFFNDTWHIFATNIGEGIGISYLSFTDWSVADESEQITNLENENLLGYIAAPQLFYFSPQNLWYLIFQTQEPAYSTTKTPEDFLSWGPVTRFMEMPAILTDNDAVGFDYWIICDDTDCYMFFTGLNGILYRARTAKGDFPNGFEGSTEIVLQDEQYSLFDSCSVYKMAGTDQYLLLVTALGDTGRYVRSWTGNRLDGNWTPLADTEDNPFASMNNISGADWLNTGIAQGEMIRQTSDEKMTINTCNMQYIYSAGYSGEDTDAEYYGLALLNADAQ